MSPSSRVMRVIARMNIGGPAYHVSILSGRMDRGRYETVLLTGSLGPGEGSFEDLARRYGADRRDLPGLRPEVNPLSDLRALVNLIRAIRRFRPDVVHTHTAKAGMLGRLAAILTPGVRPVLIHTYHGHVLTGYFGTAVSCVYRTIERVLAMGSTCLIGVSTATVDELVGMRIAPRRKFRIIPIGLDLGELLAVERSMGTALRSELGLGPGDILATFVGRLVPIKRVDLLLQAIAQARLGDASVQLAVVGDGELREELQGCATELGLDGVVHFLGFREDLPAIAAATDIAVLASDNEGTPVALIEQAAAGRPAVATDVGGVGEIVTQSTGILVPAGHVEGLAQALTQLARDPEGRARMGRAAREHVRGRFAAERLIGDIESLYDELLMARSAR